MALRIAQQTASPDRLIRTAEAAIDAGNYERAVELLSDPELKESKEKDLAPSKMLAFALLKLGKNQEAIEIASFLIRRSPFEALGFNLLALALHGMREYAAAERFFRRVTELEPAHPEARRSIVDCMRGKNQFGSGLSDFAAPLLELLEMAPQGTPQELLNFGIQAYERGQQEPAADCFFRALEQDQKNPLLFRYLGMVLMDQGNLDKAMVAIAEAIRLAPSNADGFNMMGVLLTRLEHLGAAEKFFERTRLLNPGHATVQASLRRIQGKISPIDDSLSPVLALLAIWVPRISLCMIAKNEEKFLAGCLESVKGAVDEIVLVDTGSTDKTVAIAEEYHAKVFHFPWSNDFAAARNEALSHASGDWILVLDADERLAPDSDRVLRKMAWNRGVIGCSLVIDNRLGESEESSHLQRGTIFRFYQNRPDMRYVGAIHEQMFPAAKASGLPQAESDARILHLGYLESTFQERDKLHRNLDLLLEQAKNEPQNPYVFFNLGQTYKMAGELEPAEKNYRQGLKLLQEQKHPLDTPYYLALYLNLGLLYHEHKLYEKNLAVCAESIALYPDYPDLRFAKGLSLMELGRYEEALETFRSTLAFQGRVYASGSDPGTTSYKVQNAMAVVYTRMRNWPEARRCFERAIKEWPFPNPDLLVDFGCMAVEEGNYKDALSRFAKALELQSDHANALIGASLAYAGLDLYQDALQVVRKAAFSHPEQPCVGFHLGDALLNAGFYSEALKTLAAESRREPGNWLIQQNSGLAELLLGDPLAARKRWEAQPAARSALSFLDFLEGKEIDEIGEEAASQWLFFMKHLLRAGHEKGIERCVRGAEWLSIHLPETTLGLAHGLLQADLPEWALSVLLSLKDRRAQDPRVFYFLGEACLKKDLRADARVMFERTLELKPSFYEARRRLLTL
jgi:tetratricopeptide (TPR) repeat protein